MILICFSESSNYERIMNKVSPRPLVHKKELYLSGFYPANILALPKLRENTMLMFITWGPHLSSHHPTHVQIYIP